MWSDKFCALIRIKSIIRRWVDELPLVGIVWGCFTHSVLPLSVSFQAAFFRCRAVEGLRDQRNRRLALTFHFWQEGWEYFTGPRYY